MSWPIISLFYRYTSLVMLTLGAVDVGAVEEYIRSIRLPSSGHCAPLFTTPYATKKKREENMMREYIKSAHGLPARVLSYGRGGGRRTSHFITAPLCAHGIPTKPDTGPRAAHRSGRAPQMRRRRRPRRKSSAFPRIRLSLSRTRRNPTLATRSLEYHRFNKSAAGATEIVLTRPFIHREQSRQVGLLLFQTNPLHVSSKHGALKPHFTLVTLQKLVRSTLFQS